MSVHTHTHDHLYVLAFSFFPLHVCLKGMKIMILQICTKYNINVTFNLKYWVTLKQLLASILPHPQKKTSTV